MKMINLLFCLLVAAAFGVYGQSMNVHTKSSGTLNYQLSDIDSITFELGIILPIDGVTKNYVWSYSWAPTGNKIAYVPYDSNKTYNCDLVIAEPNFTNPSIVCSGLSYVTGLDDWRGEYILFTKDDAASYTSYDGSGEIWKIKSDGTGLTKLTFTQTNGIKTVTVYQPYTGTACWGKFVNQTSKIYFTAFNGNGWPKTYLCNSDGTDQYSTVSTGWSWSAAVSPLGNKLFFTTSSDWNMTTTIYIANSDGSNPTVFSSPGHPEPEIAVSPDGNTVAYTYGTMSIDYSHNVSSGTRDIHLKNIDGTNDRALFSDSYDDGFSEFITNNNIWQDSFIRYGACWNPWSPDGQWIVFTSKRSGSYQIYKIKTDGTGLTQISSVGSYYNFAPSISADGKYVAFLRLPIGSESKSPLPVELVIKNF